MFFIKHLFTEVTEIPEYFKKDHFPSLNGFRAVSVFIVIIYHSSLSTNHWYQIIFNGSLGVNVFFVLSGFLITSLLLKEKATTGTISLKSFYIRRALRILPAAYLYLIIIALLTYFFHLGANYIFLAAAAVFLVDFEFLSKIQPPIVSHYWSLSVEEQFYFLFPVIVKKNFKLFVLFILFIVFFLPLLCTLQYFLPAINHGVLYALTHFLIKFQGISIGCFFSILCYKNILKLNKFKYSLLLKVLITVAIFAFVHTASFNVLSIYTNLINSLLIGWLIVLNLFEDNDVYYKFLNLKYVSQIGILSYSIYIWHLLTIHFVVKRDNNVTYPISIILIFVVAWLSYNYLEKPFLRLKSRYAVVKDKM